MIRLMVGVLINTKMELLMKVSGKRINSMALEKRDGQMVQCMKATTLKGRNMAEGSCNLLINLYMMESSI
jgi:hypothetical protein